MTLKKQHFQRTILNNYFLSTFLKSFPKTSYPSAFGCKPSLINNFKFTFPLIKKSFPKLPVLVFSSYSENQYAVRVLRSGASGYITKDSAPHVLVDAVKQVLLGKKYITASVAEKLVSTLDHERERPLHEQLSDREFEVLKLLVAGKSVSDIAEILSLSITTVSTYRARILQKMHMESNAELIYYAIEHDLI